MNRYSNTNSMYPSADPVQSITYNRPFLMRYRVLFIVLASILLSWLIMLVVLFRPFDPPEPSQQLHLAAPQSLDWQVVTPVNPYMAPLLLPPTYTVTKNTESILEVEKEPQGNSPVAISFSVDKATPEDAQNNPLGTIQHIIRAAGRLFGSDIREGSIMVGGYAANYDLFADPKGSGVMYVTAFYGKGGQALTVITAQVSYSNGHHAVQDLDGILYGFAFN